MLKRLPLLYILLVCSLTTNAQIVIGTGSGISTNFVTLTSLEEHFIINKSNYYLSASIESVPSQSNFSFFTELQFQRKGFSIFQTDNFIDNPFELEHLIKSKYSTVGISPALKWNVTSSISILGGVNFQYKIKEKNDIAFYEWLDYQEQHISNFDIGPFIGVRTYIQPFYFQFAYQFGFIDVIKNDFPDSYGAVLNLPELYLRNFQVGIGYNFGITPLAKNKQEDELQFIERTHR